jgi:hypothetical protein
MLALSCNTENVAVKPDSANVNLSQAGITSIETISNSSLVYSKFKKSEFFKDFKSDKFGNLDESEISLISYENKDLKILSIKVKSLISGSTINLAAVFDPKENDFKFSTVYEYSANRLANLETANQYYPDGSKFLTVNVNLSTGKINKVVSFSNFKSKFTSARLGGGSYDNCMNIAFGACSGDAACGIMCGLVFFACVSATMIACI